MRSLFGWAAEMGRARAGMGISSTKGTRVKALTMGTAGRTTGDMDIPGSAMGDRVSGVSRLSGRMRIWRKQALPRLRVAGGWCGGWGTNGLRVDEDELEQVTGTDKKDALQVGVRP